MPWINDEFLLKPIRCVGRTTLEIGPGFELCAVKLVVFTVIVGVVVVVRW